MEGKQKMCDLIMGKEVVVDTRHQYRCKINEVLT